MVFIKRSEHPELIKSELHKGWIDENKKEADSEWSYFSLCENWEMWRGFKDGNSWRHRSTKTKAVCFQQVCRAPTPPCVGISITQVWALAASSLMQEQPCFLSSQQSLCSTPSLWVPRLIFQKHGSDHTASLIQSFGHSSRFLMIQTKGFMGIYSSHLKFPGAPLYTTHELAKFCCLPSGLQSDAILFLLCTFLLSACLNTTIFQGSEVSSAKLNSAGPVNSRLFISLFTLLVCAYPTGTVLRSLRV